MRNASDIIISHLVPFVNRFIVIIILIFIIFFFIAEIKNIRGLNAEYGEI